MQLTAYISDKAPVTVALKGATSQGGVVCPRPPVPSYEQGAARAADEGPGRSLSDGAISEKIGRSGIEENDIVVKERLRPKKWALFLGGNVISAAVVFSEIAQTAVLFRQFLRETDKNTNGGEANAGENKCYDDASTLRFFAMFALIFGLLTELSFTVGLSLIYRSPLDIKSAHKIPHNDTRSCVGAMMVNVFAPFSWGVIYTCGGIVGFGLNTRLYCIGRGGSGLNTYLSFSSLYMVFVGLKMLGVSMFMVFFSCGSPAKCTDGCCAVVGKFYAHRILSIAAFLDLFWQLQGAVWLYRMGAVSLAALIVLFLFDIAGGMLAAFGSQAPDVVEELVGPQPLVVTSGPPDAAELP